MERLSKIDKLIKAFQIFKSYNEDASTMCVVGAMYICEVKPACVTDGDIKALAELGFEIDAKYGCFYSSEHGLIRQTFKNQ